MRTIARNIKAIRFYEQPIRSQGKSEYLLYGIQPVSEAAYNTLSKMYENTSTPQETDCSIQEYLYTLMTSYDLDVNNICYSREIQDPGSNTSVSNISGYKTVNCTPLFLLEKHMENLMICGEKYDNSKFLNTLIDYVSIHTKNPERYIRDYETYIYSDDKPIMTKPLSRIQLFNYQLATDTLPSFDRVQTYSSLRSFAHITHYLSIADKDVPEASLFNSDINIRTAYYNTIRNYKLISGKLYKELLENKNVTKTARDEIWSLKNVKSLAHLQYKIITHKILLRLMFVL